MMRAEAKECVPNKLCNGKEYDERTMIDNENDMDYTDNDDVVEKKENGWILPKSMW